MFRLRDLHVQLVQLSHLANKDYGKRGKCVQNHHEKHRNGQLLAESVGNVDIAWHTPESLRYRIDIDVVSKYKNLYVCYVWAVRGHKRCKLARCQWPLIIRTDRLHNVLSIVQGADSWANPCQDAVVMILLKGSERTRGRKVIFGSFRSCGLEAGPTSNPF